MSSIQVEHVTRRFGALTAVDDVSFSIDAGEIVGFLGPNGAGKSTLLRMLSTWLAPDAGRIRVAGHDVAREPQQVRAAIGYLTEHNALYDTMRVDAFLAFAGRVRGLEGERLRERLAWAVHHCALEPVLRRRVQECSKGFRQRVGLAAALLHDPPVLLLDEPTHGLDPVQVVEFRAFLGSLRADRAILFSSHILSEVTTISERLLILHRGALVFDGAVGALRERAARRGGDLEAEVLALVRAEARTS